MVGTHSTKTQRLAQITAMRVKGGRAENTIVSVITLDRHPDICRFAFQKQLSTYGITGGSGELVVDKHESAAMIHINCSTGVSI
jgi:hypothetical protein